jgi:predicted ribosome quality control (RQC) complex YloA/Tae2 family protein
MRDISGIELNVAASELRYELENLFFKSFYELGDGAFLLALSKGSKETDVYIRLNKTVNETTFKEQSTAPTQFAQNVRKALAGMRVKGIQQHAFDRIIAIDLAGRENKKLIVELFGKGNLLIVKYDNLTELAYRNVSFKDRSARKNMLYGFPKSESIGPGEADAETVGRIVAEVGALPDRLIAALAKRIGIGPLYIEDIIARAGLDPRGLADNQGIAEGRLAEELLAFFERARSPEPRIYSDETGFVDFAIVPLKKYEDDHKIKAETFDTLNHLLDRLYIEERSTGLDENKAREIRELEASVEKLKVQMKSEAETSVSYVEIGNLIFGHMHELNDMIAKIKKAKPKSAEEFKDRFDRIVINKIDPKSKIATVELKD